MRRTLEQRRVDRAAGVGRTGDPLPRALGANPRALRSTAGARPQQADQLAQGRKSRAEVTAAAIAAARELARTMDCPACRAGAGHACTRRDGRERLSCHAARHELAAASSRQAGRNRQGPRQGLAVTDRRSREGNPAGVDGEDLVGHHPGGAATHPDSR